MKERILKQLEIAIILIISAFIYFYKINLIPSGVYVDEASVIYNALSISQTGRDEYGFQYPLYFRLMGSYTPGFFVYLSALTIKIFNSIEVGIFRSISAVAALVSVYFFYKLIKKLNIFRLDLTYIVVTFFYSISPWIVFNARVGYETTLGFLIFNIGAYFLYIALTKRSTLVWGILFLSISTYISHNQRFLVPLFLLTYVIFFRNTFIIKGKLRYLLPPLVIGMITQIPNILMLGTEAFWVKNVQFEFKNIWNFLMYLSPKTLFFESPDIDLQHTIPKLSMMYNWMAVPYLVGFYFLFKNIKKVNCKFIFLYGIVSLFPAVMSGYFHSTQRSLAFAVPLMIIVGLGIDKILIHFGNPVRHISLIFLSVYSLIILFSSYFVLFPVERAIAWNYGYKQVSEYIKDNPANNYVFDSARNPRAYILLLYYLKYPPGLYQNEVDSFFKHNYYNSPPPPKQYKLGNIETRTINWEKDPLQNLVIIGDNLSVSENQMKEHNLSKINEVKDVQNNTVFVFYQTHPERFK